MMSPNKNIYSTGNILSLNDLKKKAGLNSRDELIETLKITMTESSKAKGDAPASSNGVYESAENADRKDLKITVKIFMNTIEAEYLEEALDEVYEFLQTDTIESLVIVIDKNDLKGNYLDFLKVLWKVLEEFNKKGKLCGIGVSDIDTDNFVQLFEWAEIKPSIIQINLSTCCVVPPALQEFTKQNDIQLLTHSDPTPILPKDALIDSFGNGAELRWIARYQVHLRCRGVLSSKGYLVKINE